MPRTSCKFDQPSFRQWLQESLEYWQWLDSPTPEEECWESFAVYLSMSKYTLTRLLLGTMTPFKEDIITLAHHFGDSVYLSLEPGVFTSLRDHRDYCLKPHKNTSLSPESVGSPDLRFVAPSMVEPIQLIDIVQDLPTQDVSTVDLASATSYVSTSVESIENAYCEYPLSDLVHWNNYLRLTSLTYAWVSKLTQPYNCQFSYRMQDVLALYTKAIPLSIRVAGLSFTQTLYAKSEECIRDLPLVFDHECSLVFVCESFDRLKSFVQEAESLLNESVVNPFANSPFARLEHLYQAT